MKRIASGILITVLLVVTIGVPIYRHTCHVFDRSEIAVLAQDQCCAPGESQAEASLDFKCCSLEQFDTALDYETLTADAAQMVVSLVSIEFLGESQVISPVEVSEDLPVLRPPPLANRILLNKIQLYLI